jgi:hypothetical protein
MNIMLSVVATPEQTRASREQGDIPELSTYTTQQLFAIIYYAVMAMLRWG